MPQAADKASLPTALRLCSRVAAPSTRSVNRRRGTLRDRMSCAMLEVGTDLQRRYDFALWMLASRLADMVKKSDAVWSALGEPKTARKTRRRAVAGDI